MIIICAKMECANNRQNIIVVRSTTFLVIVSKPPELLEYTLDTSPSQG